MHYVTPYSSVELRKFHCKGVFKIPLSELDPITLIGFLCKMEAD